MVGLSKEQIASFEKDGFLVIKDFYDPGPLKDRTQELLLKNNESQITTFTTGDAQTSDQYFFDSADKISYFYEQEAVKQGLVSDKLKSINKMGHALHELDEEFKIFTFQQNIKDISASLKFEDPRVLQSMVIFKQPRIGDKVDSHIDSTFLFTRPTSCVGFWFALEDCRPDNGCMWFAPGSHLKYPLTKRFVRDGQGKFLCMIAKKSLARFSEHD